MISPNVLTDKISYLIVDTHNHEMAQAALRHSQTVFPLRRSVVFSDRQYGWESSDFIQINPIESIKDYSKFILENAWKFVATEYFIVIQYDGFVLNGSCFCESFLDYDYIGATWPHFETHNVGNGGFSLRSVRLMQKLQHYLKDEDYSVAEDLIVCRKYRPLLEKNNKIRFAPVSVANRFSQELVISKTKTFGFHGYALLPIVYRHNLEFLFQNMPAINNVNKLNEFKAGCKAVAQSQN